MIDKILKEFEENFDHIVPHQGGFIVGKKGTAFDNCACDLSYIEDWLKEKLIAFEKSIKEEFLKKIEEERDSVFKNVDEFNKSNNNYKQGYWMALNTILNNNKNL